MKKITIFSLLAFLFLGLSAQEISYKAMMEDYRYSVYDVIEAAEKYFSTHDKGQGSGYKGYMRWRDENEPLFSPTGDRSQFRSGIFAEEYNRVMQEQAVHKTASSHGEHWRYMGPDGASNLLPASYAAGIGRTDAVWAGFSTLDTVLAGALAGGFWKTTNGGATWKTTTQDLPAVGVNDIEVDPNDHNEVWISTRHATGYSLGLMKSTDFGDTWNTTSLNFPVQNEYLYDIYISPTNPDTMYVNGYYQFYRSTDGGNTWVSARAGWIRNYAVHPNNSQIIYAVDYSNRNDLIVSTNGGTSWSTATTVNGNNNANAWIVTTPASPDMVYWASNNGIWRSTNQGQSFTQMGPNPSNRGLMTFGVSDTNADLVVVGSLDQFISSNGGSSFSLFAAWVNSTAPNYVHADGRKLQSWNGNMYLCTDGYIGRSTDNGATWTRLNDQGTGIRQFYRIGTSPTRTDRVVGGSQDNGTSILIDSTWYEWFGGDGMECHLHWTMPEIWWGNWQFGGLRRTMNDGITTASIKPNTSSGDWITPSVIDRLNETSLFIGYDTLFKSTDLGSTWTPLWDFSTFGNLNLLAISPSDSNYLYASYRANIFKSTDNGNNWTQVNNGLPNISITRIAVHPRDPQKVAVTFGNFSTTNKVFLTTDGGSTWNNISGNLSKLPIRSAVWQDTDINRLFIGQDGLIWYKDDNNANWILYADSLPVQPYRDLEILHGANTIRAAVYGRGLWEAPLPGAGDAPRITRIDIQPGVTIDNKPNHLDSVYVQARITSGDPLSSTTLLWGLDGVNFPNTLSMSVQNGDTFISDQGIPPHAIGTQVYFRVRAEDVDGDTARSEGIVYKVKEAIRCGGAGSVGTGGDWIANVQLNTINNSSQMNYYSDYSTTQVTSLEKGQTYTTTVTLNFAFACDSVFGWIDWNQNLTFDPAEQMIFTDLDVNHQATATFTVPQNIATGTTVMRVRNIYDCSGAFSDPCNDYFGEVEDYGIEVTDAVVGLDPGSTPLEIYPNPTKATVRVRGASRLTHIRVLDMRGATADLKAERISESEWQIDLSAFPAGVYLIEAEMDGQTLRGKVIRE